MRKPLTHWWSTQLDEVHLSLSRPEALIPLSLLGLISGLLAGGVIVLFRLSVEGFQDELLPGQGAENYEGLSAWVRLLLPVLGGVMLAIMFRWFANGVVLLGVGSVMERMSYHQGHLTIRGFMLQFFGAATAIISGHSVGREGPHIFLGAATSSLLGQFFQLPNNSIRTLVGCGAAAGIAASFNTPLAGVIFSLEVIMLDYTVASFIPIILSAVTATLLANAILGSEAAFIVPAIELSSLGEIPLLALLGFAAGAASALYIYLLQSITVSTKNYAIWWKVIAAGWIVGFAGLLMPEVMGIGYDTVNAALIGQYGILFLFSMLILKMIATAACIGLGVPGGTIGPALFLGASLGSLVGLIAQEYIGIDSHIAFYALLGMGAMMGASLQAPLAALTAMLELTQTPGIIMPGMLVIVIASITASEIFGRESLFITMLHSSGLDYKTTPVMQALRRAGVASVMNTNFVRVDWDIKSTTAHHLLDGKPDWILVDESEGPSFVLPGVDLARAMQTLTDEERADNNFRLNLVEIPAERHKVCSIHINATLQEALEVLDESGSEALYVQHKSEPGARIFGLLTRGRIESAYW